MAQDRNAVPRRNIDRNRVAFAGAQRPEDLRRDLDDLEVRAASTDVTASTALETIGNTNNPSGRVDFDLPPVAPNVGFYATINTFDGTSQTGTANRVDDLSSFGYRNGTEKTLVAGDLVLVQIVGEDYVVVAIIVRANSYIPPSFLAPPNVGFPLGGASLGSGFAMGGLTGVGTTNPPRYHFEFDDVGSLGMGAGVFLGWSQSTSNPTLLAHNPFTGVTSDLGRPTITGFPTSHNNIDIQIAGPYIIVKQNAGAGTNDAANVQTTAYAVGVWDNANGWRVAKQSSGTTDRLFAGRIGWIEVSGTYYLVGRSSTTTATIHYIDLTTCVEAGTSTSPSTTAEVACRGPFMWTGIGHTAVASLTPTWTLTHSGLNVTTALRSRRADIGEAGDLVVFTTFSGPPATAGINMYFWDPVPIPSVQKQQLFTVTGDPLDGEPVNVTGSQVRVGDGLIAISGWLRADYFNPSLSPLEYIGVVWVTEGITSAAVVHTDPAVYSAAVGSSGFDDDYGFSAAAIWGRTIVAIAGSRIGGSGTGPVTDSQITGITL
jgi:hypothetical protein